MKVPLSISIDEDDMKALKLLSEKTGLSVSSFFELHTKGFVRAAKLSGILGKKEPSKLDVLRFLGQVAKMEA